MKNLIISVLLVALFTVKIGWRVSGFRLFLVLAVCVFFLWVTCEMIDYTIQHAPKGF